jgi:hypothetical protein
MNTYEEKISLLSEMIAFATVDGELHHREYEFLLVIAKELNIDKAIFNDLFHQESPKIVIKSELERFHQFYRLALLMHISPFIFFSGKRMAVSESKNHIAQFTVSIIMEIIKLVLLYKKNSSIELFFLFCMYWQCFFE